MPAALFHPGDLALSDWLMILFVLLVVPALVLGALAWAVYKGLTASRESLTALNVEKNLEPNDEGGGGR